MLNLRDFKLPWFEPSGGNALKGDRMSCTQEAAMLAEIFFLRLETMLRASEEADRAKKHRFVPLSDNVFPMFREKQASVGNRTVSA